MTNKTIALPLELARTAIECVEGDIERSTFSDHPDYEDEGEMEFYANRARVLSLLRRAVIEALNEEV